MLVQPDDIGNDILNGLNTTINVLTGDADNGGSYGSPGAAGQPSNPPEDGPNSLTNGAGGPGGQYGDGAPPNNPPAGAGGSNSGNPNAGSAAGSAMGASAGSVGSSTPPAPISAAKLVKNSKNLVGKVPAGWGNKRNKIPDPGASSKTPTNPPPSANSNSTTPTNTNSTTPPVPMPSPAGPALGGGSDDNATPVATTDGTTPVATDVPATVPAALGVDLVLEDVHQASPATLVAGPAYEVTFRNQGTDPAGKFQVGIFAGLDGKLTKQAPRAVVEVNSLAAGEVKTVTLRLPKEALRLTDADNKPVAFTHLLVVVDVKNAVPETDKTNNAARVARADLEAAAK